MRELYICLAWFSVLVSISSLFTGVPTSIYQQLVMQTYLTHGLLFGIFFVLLSMNVKNK